MTPAELLATLRGLQVRLRVEGDQLHLTAPRGALSRELEAELARSKPELLELVRAAAPSPIERVSRDAPLALSSFQERMWILSRLDPASTAYNLVAWLREEGPSDLDALRESATELVRRHEILRCNFRESAGEPRLVIAPPSVVVPQTFDLGAFDVEEAKEELKKRATLEARRSVSLLDGQLFRPIFARLGPNDYALMIVAHHIITDGWSLGLVLKEWRTLYQGRCAGSLPALPEPTLQYADYAAWQRGSLEASDMQARLQRWVDALAGAPTVLTLPSDRPRGVKQTFEGGVHGFSLDEATASRLLAFCGERGVTPFMVWLAVFGLLLNRYSGQNDILIGSPAASRKRRELESILGPFVNTLVFRHRQDAGETGLSLLERTRSSVMMAHANQDVPFERLVDPLAPERTMAHPPIFQVACAFHNSPMRSEFAVMGGGSMYELTLNGFQREDVIEGSIEYNLSLFDEATIVRAAGHFQMLLRSLLVAPEAPVASYRVLPEGESRRLLDEWNATQRSWDDGRLFIERFEQLAAERPERIAAVCRDERLTYAELDARADDLARTLTRRGVDAGVCVAVLMERSLEMLIAALGVMKAGGVYVPLDPQYPSARLAYILEDSGARFVVSSASSAAALPDHGLAVITVDAKDGGGEGRGVRRERSRDAAELAYVIYTSGTTGKPKGVEVTRGGLDNVLRSLQDEPGLHPDDVLVAVTTFAFDIAAVELFLPLSVGARVVIASADVLEHGHRLRELLADCAATVMQATPATWQMLIDAGWGVDDAPTGLRVWSGGEALSRTLANALLDRSPDVWNLYGPTETTIWSTTGRVERRLDTGVPIGRPLANTRVYVLDARGEPTPIGVPGELHIGGAGVARGYRHLTDLTHDRFVPDPFAPRQGSRLYRTGDLVRWSAAGELEYIGRLDHQVKVRGHRIELGEIESVLATRPSVRAAAAHVWDSRIVAYVVFHAGQEETASDVRRFLRAHLPEYMIPGFVVPLAELPMTANRKIDRKRLPDPRGAPSQSREFVPPADGMEQAIAGIWSELLGSEYPISADDNFFELGGHSLLSLKAVYRIEQLTGSPLDPRAIFFETLRQVAARHPAPSAPPLHSTPPRSRPEAAYARPE